MVPGIAFKWVSRADWWFGGRRNRRYWPTINIGQYDSMEGGHANGGGANGSRLSWLRHFFDNQGPVRSCSQTNRAVFHQCFRDP